MSGRLRTVTPIALRTALAIAADVETVLDQIGCVTVEDTLAGID